MAGNVRIEKCQTQTVANFRQGFLTQLGFTVLICQPPVAVITTTASADGKTTTGDQTSVINDPYVVIAIQNS